MKQQSKARMAVHGIALFTGLMVAQSLWAAEPWVAVPSAVVGPVAVVAGGNLGAWQAVTVKVTDPQGNQSSQSATANDKGVLKLELTPGVKGAYKVDVFNTGGQRIGGGDFIVSR
jgi:hypothetical protein